MSRLGVMPLDSYRLAQYASQTACFICGEGNNQDADLCRHCQAPMALAHQSADRKEPPRMVAVIGSAGAGKTVYLGMLSDMLSRENDRLQILARGAFSISLQQSVMGALARCQFPQKTPNEPDRWHWLHCQVKVANRKRPIELIMPDLAGEALLEEMEHRNSYPVIREFLAKCSGVMLLIDVAELESGEQSQDFFTMKMISYLCELDADKKKGWGTRPVSLIFAKADRCDACFDDPSAYAQKHTPGLWQQCRERLRHYQFFAAGVAGACGYRRELDGRVLSPLRIEPRGITPPFQWLIDRLGK
jgi:hypothetical protein